MKIIKILLRHLLSPNKFIFHRLLFWLHECLVTLRYGHSKPIHEFYISEPLLNKLQLWVDSNSNIQNKEFTDIDGMLINAPISLETGLHLFEKYTIHLPQLDNELAKDLHSEIRAILKKYIKSPFAIVNTRSWNTRPNLELFGPFQFHRDGFWPGHMKAMLYITPLNEKYGYFETKDEIYTNKSPGYGLLFENSDIRHRGVSGLSENRISFEITFFRSFVNVEQKHIGHYLGRHYRNIFTPYFMRFGPEGFKKRRRGWL